MLIEAHFGTMDTYFSVDDRPIRVGGRSVRFSEVRSIDKKKGAVTTTLVHLDKDRGQYETVSGRVRDLPKLHGEYNDITLDLDEAQHIKVGAYDPGDVKIPYELELASNGATVANSHGSLTLTDLPRSLGSPEEAKIEMHGTFFSVMRFGESDGLRLNPIIDLQKDVQAGSWTRNNGALETKADPAGWCNIPVLAKQDYHLEVTITPKQKKRGELLLVLPVGKSRALLHVDGEKGFMYLDLAEPGDSQNESRIGINPFEKNKKGELDIHVSVSDEYAMVFAGWGDQLRQLSWSGKTKYLAVPKDVPPTLTPMAIGHRNLEMSISSMRIDSDKGGLQVQREMPFAYLRTSEAFLGRWPLNVSPEAKKIPSTGEGIAALQIGSPQIGAAPALFGSGAMKLSGDGSGLQLEESEYTNRGWRGERTYLFWFKADAPDAKDKRQYLLDEGGTDKGFAIYLEDGVLFAGGWDNSQHWKSWLKAPGIVADRWYHVTLSLDAKEHDRNQSLKLFLNGVEVAHAWANGIDTHEPIAFGTIVKTTRACDNEPVNPAAVNVPFSGMMDEIEVYNAPLGLNPIRILAGGSFKSDATADK